MPVDWSCVKVGDEVDAEDFGPVTRETLARFAEGSGDHNPLHTDTGYARKAGYDDVVAHGMLSMAYLGRYLEGIASTRRIRTWSARFLAPTPAAAVVRCSARVASIDPANGDVTVLLNTMTDGGVNTITGSATLQVSQDNNTGGARRGA